MVSWPLCADVDLLASSATLVAGTVRKLRHVVAGSVSFAAHGEINATGPRAWVLEETPPTARVGVRRDHPPRAWVLEETPPTARVPHDRL